MCLLVIDVAKDLQRVDADDQIGRRFCGFARQLQRDLELRLFGVLDFFHDLKRCLRAAGIAVFNTFADLDQPRAYAHFLTTLKTELPFIMLYRPDYGLAQHVNSFVVAGAAPLPAPAGADLAHVPLRHLATLSAMLRNPLPLDQQLLAHGRVITDAGNPAAMDLADSQLINRRYVIEALPAAFFVN